MLHNRRHSGPTSYLPLSFRLWLLILFVGIPALSATSATQPKPGNETSNAPLDFEAMMKELKDPETRMRKERQTPLHIAAEDGKTNDVSRLLKEGALMDANDRWKRTPLHLAAEWGHVGIVKELLTSG